MTLQDASKLQPGDEVFWNDPDDGLCSRYYRIAEVDIVENIVRITDRDGSYLECYPHELI